MYCAKEMIKSKKFKASMTAYEDWDSLIPRYVKYMTGDSLT
jgi:hypothetical protein